MLGFIQKYKNIFAKGYIPWTYVISDLNGEPITGSFYEKELQKTSQKKIENRKSN